VSYEPKGKRASDGDDPARQADVRFKISPIPSPRKKELPKLELLAQLTLRAPLKKTFTRKERTINEPALLKDNVKSLKDRLGKEICGANDLMENHHLMTSNN